MPNPENPEFQPTAVLLQDMAKDFSVSAEMGYSFIQADNPDPRTGNYGQYGQPFGVRISPDVTSHPAFGDYRDVYVHSHTNGVLQTDRMVLAGELLYHEVRPGEFFQLKDEDIYYLHHAFSKHTTGHQIEYGGMRVRQESTYYRSLEKVMLGKTAGQLESFYNHAMECNERAAEGEEPFRVTDLNDGIGGTWVTFGLSIHDRITFQPEDFIEPLDDRIGDLLTVVYAYFSSTTGEARKFEIKPIKFRSVHSTELEDIEAEPVVVSLENAGAVHFPRELTARQRVLALSDVNRVLAQSRLVVA